MDMSKIPMGKIIEMELATGFLLADIFDEGTEKQPKPENPWAKLVFAYLNALAAGHKVTWNDMLTKSADEIMELHGLVLDEKKEPSSENN